MTAKHRLPRASGDRPFANLGYLPKCAVAPRERG